MHCYVLYINRPIGHNMLTMDEKKFSIIACTISFGIFAVLILINILRYIFNLTL